MEIDLFNVIRFNDLKRFRELIEAGANINAISDIGFTPLISAIHNGNPEMVKTLVKLGVDI